MGLWISKLFGSLFSRKKPAHIVMLGLDNAGKTTLLQKMKLGEIVTTIPTIGFHVETIEYKSIKMTVWDVGGQTVIRPLWKHYFTDTSAVVYVVDSSDTRRMEESAGELHKILQDDQLRDAVLLVMANKSDLPKAISAAEVSEALQLHTLRDRNWHIHASSAITGDGIFESFDWLTSELTATTGAGVKAKGKEKA